MRELELLTKKGIYPYECIDSSERFRETSLSPKEMFFSSLTEEGISDEDYNHAQKVWRDFGMENLGEYHDCLLYTSPSPRDS